MNITVFNFDGKAVRTVVVDEVPMFVAKDVAECLGYKNPRDAITKHCKKKDDVAIRDAIGRNQETSVIPESDVYRLVMRSKLKEAERFQDWVVEQVLPSIRKNGAYIAGQEEDDPEMILIKGLAAAKKIITQKKAELAKKDAQLIEAVELIEAKEEKIDKLENLFHNGGTIVSFCKQLNGVNTQKVMRFFEVKNWLYDARRDDTKGKPKWKVKGYARDLYLTCRNKVITPFGLEPFEAEEMELLAKGKRKIFDLYIKGQLPMKKDWDGKYTHEKDI